MRILVQFILLLVIVFLGQNCLKQDCSVNEYQSANADDPLKQSDSCTSTYREVSSINKAPDPIDPVESEPNDYFYQANVILQTRDANGSFDPFDNSYARVGTMNTEVDEDWYKLELTSADFDRLDPSRTGCQYSNSNTGLSQSEFASCFYGAIRRPDPNGTPDHKDYVSSTTTGQQRLFRPRFIIKVDCVEQGPDGDYYPCSSSIDLRVEVYPPGLTMDRSGILTREKIADSYLHASRQISSIDDNTLVGKLRSLNASKPLLVNFPSVFSHNVRVNNTESQKLFYNSCFMQNITLNPAAVTDETSLSYQSLIKKDLNGYRTLDAYTVGTYFIRVTSSAVHKNKSYRIKWYWNTGSTADGGVNLYSVQPGSSIHEEEISYSYDHSNAQITGSDSVALSAVSTCSSKAALSGNDPVVRHYPSDTSNRTLPFCKKTTEKITCQNTDGTYDAVSTDSLYCFNNLNLTDTTSDSEQSALKVCEGDMNRDGIPGSDIRNLGCMYETNACTNNGKLYDEDMRVCDCLTSCDTPSYASWSADERSGLKSICCNACDGSSDPDYCSALSCP